MRDAGRDDATAEGVERLPQFRGWTRARWFRADNIPRPGRDEVRNELREQIAALLVGLTLEVACRRDDPWPHTCKPTSISGLCHVCGGDPSRRSREYRYAIADAVLPVVHAHLDTPATP